MKTHICGCIVVAIILSLLRQTSASQNAVDAKKAGGAPCDTHLPEPGFIKSWAGQPGVPDHADSTPINNGAFMACLALAAPSSVPPACYVSYQNGGQYTLPSHSAMRSPKPDVITLSCNGKSPTCCKLQIGPALSALKKTDPDIKLISPAKASDKTKP